MDWQAVDRSAVVCPEGERPAAVRALFHSSTVDRASTGCLLEQVRNLCCRLRQALILPSVIVLLSSPRAERMFLRNQMRTLYWCMRCICARH